MAEGGEGNEITLEQALKVVKDSGAKVFDNDHSLDEYVQGSEAFTEQKNKVGMAYKKASQIISTMHGVELKDGDRFEDVVERAKEKLIEITKPPKKDDEPKENPELEALKTEHQAKLEELQKLQKSLQGYQTNEFESQKLSLLEKAMDGKQFDLPDGIDDKFKANHRNIFNKEVLEKAEWTQENGKVYMKIDGNTYQGDSITSKLKEIIDNSGYTFKSKADNGSIPNITSGDLGGVDAKKRNELFLKSINEKGIAPGSKAHFQEMKKFGLTLPPSALKSFPDLAK